ncbi:MAG: hypothetical protein H0U73_13945 [Tatlockia sp.]|nr:hypothetical protein [Tatlockia sp.]
MGIFKEKCIDALKRSASILTGKNSWWAFDLAKAYKKSSLVRMAFETPQLAIALLILWPVFSISCYIILPVLNVLSTGALALVNLLVSPIVVPILTLWHVAKDYFRKDESIELCNKLINLDEKDFAECVEKPLNNYEPNSDESKNLESYIRNPSQHPKIRELPNDSQNKYRKIDGQKFALLTFFKNSPDEYNAGREITSKLIDAYNNFQKNKVISQEATQKKQTEQERVIADLDSIHNAITPKF